jgi:hypothetical protein
VFEINFNLGPSEGYVFTERDGTVLRAEGWRLLERRIRGYRALNKLDPGHPWEEIVIQTCAKQPSLCRDPQVKPSGPRGSGSLSFNQRVIQNMVHLIGLKRTKRLPRGDNVSAASRAAICASCPRQKSLTESCKACLSTVEASRRVLLDEIESRHKNLLPCAVLAEDCQTTVHVDQAPTDAPGLPSNCWRRPPT